MQGPVPVPSAGRGETGHSEGPKVVWCGVGRPGARGSREQAGEGGRNTRAVSLGRQVMSGLVSSAVIKH